MVRMESGQVLQQGPNPFPIIQDIGDLQNAERGSTNVAKFATAGGKIKVPWTDFISIFISAPPCCPRTASVKNTASHYKGILLPE